MSSSVRKLVIGSSHWPHLSIDLILPFVWQRRGLLHYDSRVVPNCNGDAGRQLGSPCCCITEGWKQPQKVLTNLILPIPSRPQSSCEILDWSRFYLTDSSGFTVDLTMEAPAGARFITRRCPESSTFLRCSAARSRDQVTWTACQASLSESTRQHRHNVRGHIIAGVSKAVGGQPNAAPNRPIKVLWTAVTNKVRHSVNLPTLAA
jgi:hypothetical protein